jgi:hypothetical protein
MIIQKCQLILIDVAQGFVKSIVVFGFVAYLQQK